MVRTGHIPDILNRGHSLEQIGDQGGHGCVVFDRQHSRLAVEFGGDGFGDASDVSHGFVFGGVVLVLYCQCALKR